MKNNEIIRSPFFYVGDKYKLMPQIKELTPKEIRNYIEPFVGGGSSFLNTEGEKYILNDVNPYVIALHKELITYKDKEDELFDYLLDMIAYYGLSCSYQDQVPEIEDKGTYKKRGFVTYNKEGYLKLREDFNADQSDLLKLYLLLIYGFNHMIRFNKNNEFNLPVGNLDFNKNVVKALHDYLEFSRRHDIEFYNMDYISFLESLNIGTEDYVYLDPPYLISSSEYNKLWNKEKEKELCEYLDFLNQKKIRFGITNLLNHKGRTNEIFEKWSNKYKVFDIKSNYISFNDNSKKMDSKEVFVTNQM